MASMTAEQFDQLTADVIHAVRAAGIVPSRPFSAGQWGMVVKAMLAMGWTPPEGRE